MDAALPPLVRGMAEIERRYSELLLIFARTV